MPNEAITSELKLSFQYYLQEICGSEAVAAEAAAEGKEEEEDVSHLIQMKCLIQFMSVQRYFYTFASTKWRCSYSLRRRRRSGGGLDMKKKGATSSVHLNTHLINVWRGEPDDEEQVPVPCLSVCVA